MLFDFGDAGCGFWEVGESSGDGWFIVLVWQFRLDSFGDCGETQMKGIEQSVQVRWLIGQLRLK